MKEIVLGPIAIGLLMAFVNGCGGTSGSGGPGSDPNNPNPTGESVMTSFVDQCNKVHDEWLACLKTMTASVSQNEATTCQENYQTNQENLFKLLTPEQLVRKKHTLNNSTFHSSYDTTSCQLKSTQEEITTCLYNLTVSNSRKALCVDPSN